MEALFPYHPKAPAGNWSNDCRAVSRLATELRKQEVLVKVVLIDGSDYAEFLERKRIPDTPTAHKKFAVKRLNSRSY